MQKQPLMIALAVAPKPNILIFDEATSALENKTQSKCQTPWISSTAPAS